MPLKILSSMMLIFMLTTTETLAQDDLFPFWKMECRGSGKRAVNGKVEAFNPSTGKIIWLVTDIDGQQGMVTGLLHNGKITIFGSSGSFDYAKQQFIIKSPKECPGGFVGQGYR